MLRALRDLPAGEELFVSYNEDAVFVPLRRRRKALESWGFTCRCRRCLAEQELPAELVKRLEEIDAGLEADERSTGRLRRRYRALAAMPPAQAARSAHALLAEVQKMLQGLEAALGPANSGKGPALPDWSRASVHSAYRLCIACAQMAGDLSTTLQLERTCLAVVEVVRPGGTAHATLAAMHAVDSGACRRVSELAAAKRKRLAQQEALARALRAARTRFGRELSEAAALRLLDRLLKNSLEAAGQR
ncbi:hypothetical protein ABPG77_004289 [Micractinium sp. CCAP 211/92]